MEERAEDGPRRFRKRPVETVEAMQWHGTNMREMTAFVGPSGVRHVTEPNGPGHLIVQTPEGEARASTGDWIVRDSDGGYRPWRPEIFDETYEEAVGPLQAMAIALTVIVGLLSVGLVAIALMT